MNLQDLEKQWEGGDDEEELRTEEQIKFEKLERRRKEAQVDANKFDPRYDIYRHIVGRRGFLRRGSLACSSREISARCNFESTFPNTPVEKAITTPKVALSRDDGDRWQSDQQDGIFTPWYLNAFEHAFSAIGSVGISSVSLPEPSKREESSSWTTSAA